MDEKFLELMRQQISAKSGELVRQLMEAHAAIALQQIEIAELKARIDEFSMAVPEPAHPGD